MLGLGADLADKVFVDHDNVATTVFVLNNLEELMEAYDGSSYNLSIPVESNKHKVFSNDVEKNNFNNC